MTTNYVTKWVEARTFHTNIVAIIAKFLYKYTKFGCPLTIMTNQGTHFINNAIKYLIDHFILKPTSFIIYYLQGIG